MSSFVFVFKDIDKAKDTKRHSHTYDNNENKQN